MDLLGKRCASQDGGYTLPPITTMVSLESAYAVHMLARKLGYSAPLGTKSFVDCLQNIDGGFRHSIFSGISPLNAASLLYLLKEVIK